MYISEEESLKGLFYIVKGQYSKKEPSVICRDGETRFIGGYDPEDPNTAEWYRVIDSVTYHCTYCGSSLEGALNNLERMIVKFGTRKKFFQYVCRITSEDYYEVHYLHKTPLTREQKNKKAEGRCPGASPATKMLESAVFKEYGSYFEDLIEEREIRAYKTIREDTPLKKTQKRHRKLSMKSVEQEIPQKPVERPVEKKTLKKKTEQDKPPARKLVMKPKRKFGR